MPVETFHFFGEIKKGSTSKIIEIALDGTYTDYANDWTVWYIRNGAGSGTAPTVAEMTPGTWSSGKLVQINGDVFQYSIPDAALAAGADSVTIRFRCIDTTNNKWYYRIQLTGDDYTDGVRRGLTALPNAAADAAGGLPVSDAGGLDMDALSANVAAILVDTGTTLDGKINTIDGIVDEILVDTAEIGAAGAGLTNLPWNPAWDAEVQSEATDALNAYDPPTRTELTSDKNAIISAVNDALPGGGNILYAHTVTDTNDDPIFDVMVTVTSDADGETIVASGRSESDGTIEFYLDAGTYYVWHRKAGYDFENPVQITVSA